MKSLRILLIPSVCILVSCRKDKTDLTYKECYSEITPDSRDYFYKDAVEFGLQRLASDTLSDYPENPIYREEPVMFVLGKLSAIYNEALSLDSPLHDMIFKYKIHKLTRYERKSIAIKFSDFDIQLDFAKNPGNIGNELLDELINERGFKLQEKSKWSEWVSIKAEHQDYVNAVFARRLVGSYGIDTSGVGQWYNFEWNDRDIEYSWTNEYDEFIFIYGMGDCPCGCTEFHYWQVRVDKNCNVTLVSEYGDPLPG